MSSRILAVNGRQPAQDWQIVLAVGFFALTWFGAAIDRHSAILDRTAAASRTADRAFVALTDTELVRDMLSHD